VRVSSPFMNNRASGIRDSIMWRGRSGAPQFHAVWRVRVCAGEGTLEPVFQGSEAKGRNDTSEGVRMSFNLKQLG